MADRNLVLQLLITAKDEASSAFGKVFKYLDDNTKVVAGKVREAFSNLFSGGLASATELEAAFDAVAAKGGYTADEMVKLKLEAAKVAAQFGVTGKEAAQGLEILAAAGLTAKDAVATLPQVLALARSEGVSMDVAAEKLADSLAVMGLGFDQAGRMADVLAKGANLSTVSAIQLGESLSTVGGIAKAAGLSLEETVAALDLLAKNGLKGERAGTGLSAVLTQLQNPASTAAKALNDMGISTRDLGGVLDALRAGGARSEAAILAFGETAGPALRALIGEGSEGLKVFTEQLKNADGAAQAASDQMGGNLKQSLAALSAAWDSVKQTFAEPLLEPLAKAAKTLSDAFIGAVQSGAFSGLADAVKMVATAVGAAAEQLTKAFDFKAIGANVNSFVVGGMDALGKAMNNVGAIAGALAAGALIPLGLQIKAGIETTFAFIAAQRAMAASMTASEIAAVGFSRVMGVLMGPVGWVMVGVSALALLWKEEDKTKAATDALAGSTEAYTQKLKEQTEAQNQLALLKLNDALDAQRQKLDEAKAAYDQAAASERGWILVTEDHGGIMGKTTRIVSDANEIARIRVERLAALDTAEQALTETEKRRALIVDELKSKQEAATPANVAAEEALGKYRKGVELATAAQEKAKAALGATTRGSYDYGIAAGKLAQADGVLKQAKDVLTKATSDYNAEIQRQLREVPQATAKQEDHAKAIAEGVTQLEQGVAGAKKYTDAVEGVVKAESDGIKAAISLAQAKGYTNEVQRLSRQLAIKEAEGSIRVAKAKQAEQEMEYVLAVAKRNLLANIENKNAAQNAELALAELVVQKELAEARAAGVNTQAQEVLLQKLREVNAAKSGASSANTEHAATTEKSTEATNKNAAANRNSTDILKGLVDKVNNARQEMAGLSENTQLYFDVMLANELKQRGFAGAFDATRTAQNRLNAAIGESNPALAKLEAGLATAKEAVARLDKEMQNAPNNFRLFELAVEKAKGLAIAAFNEQAIAATRLTQRFEAFAESGSSAVGGVAVTMNELRNATMQAKNDLTLLDGQRLDALQNSIEAANDRLREMQEEAQSAQDRIAELNAEIAAEKGDTATADRLKLELDQQQQLAEVEAQLAQARAQNNRELILLYEEQKRKLEELYSLKERNLEADIKARAEQERADRAAKTQNTTGGSSGGSGGSGSAGGKTYNLNLNAGGKTLNAVTNTDPASFLDELERARRAAA